MSKLGSLLVREGLLSEADRRMIHRESGTHRGSFARSILALGVLDEDELAALFAAKTAYRIAPKNLAGEIQSDAMGLIPPHVLTWLDVIPVRKANGVLYVAMTDPTDREVIAQLEFFSGMIIKPIIASFSLIGTALKEHLASHVDFGRSEFEDFVKNHSVSATKFATTGIVAGAVAKAEPSDDVVSFAEDDDDDLELMTDAPELEPQAPEPLAETPESVVTAAPAEPTEDLVEASEVTEETSTEITDDNVSIDDEVMETTGSNMASAELAASPDLDLELGDVDFDLDDEGNEKPKETADALAPSANMDDILAGDNLGAAPAEGSEVDELANLGDATASADTGIDDVSLSLDDDLSLEPTADLAADAVQPSSLTPEDLLVPEDITGDLGAKAAVAEPAEIGGLEDGMDLGGEAATHDLALGDDLALAGDDLALGDSLATAGDDLPLGEELTTLSPGDDLVSAPASGEIPLGDDLGLEDLDLGSSEEVKSLETPPQDAAPEVIADVASDDLLGDLDVAGASTEPTLDAQIGDIDLESMNIDDGEIHANPAAVAAELDDIDLSLENLDDLTASDLGATADLEPMVESSGGDGLAAKAHSGIAALNRALVNLALLSDGKKALARLADAAGQAGIESGAVVVFDQNAIKPGVLWSQSNGKVGSIADAPAGISAEAAQHAIAQAAGKDGWQLLNDGLTEAQVKALTSGWPEAQQIPTHILVRTMPNGKSILGFAKFAGESNHEGLKESFAELVKAAGVKI